MDHLYVNEQTSVHRYKMHFNPKHTCNEKFDLSDIYIWDGVEMYICPDCPVCVYDMKIIVRSHWSIYKYENEAEENVGKIKEIFFKAVLRPTAVIAKRKMNERAVMKLLDSKVKEKNISDLIFSYL